LLPKLKSWTWATKPRMPKLTALYDACVLYPAPLRDLLMSLTQTGLFQARWTEMIHEEWIRNLLANRADLSRERLERTRDRMNAAVRDCLVEGFEPLIETLSLPDPGDRHVLAAAIRGRARVIVTFNLKDFPRARLEPYGIEAWHPDDFVGELLEMGEGKVCRALREQRARLLKPPQSVEELLGTLQAQGLAQSVAHLSKLTDQL